MSQKFRLGVYVLASRFFKEKYIAAKIKVYYPENTLRVDLNFELAGAA